jgi:hypothetical protein
MKFAAVKRFFRPVTGVQLNELTRQHAGSRGEQSVGLDEVGLDRVAREVALGVKRTTPVAHKTDPKHGNGKGQQ